MIQFFSKKLSNKKGFTLVELLLVIAILGIIAGVAVPRVLNANLGTKFKADQATANMIVSKVEAMILLGEIKEDDEDTIESVGTTAGDLDYQEDIPVCQSSKSAFNIQISKDSAGVYYVMVSSGTAPTEVQESDDVADEYDDDATTVFAVGKAQPVSVN